jgi:hypothetical protein
MGLQSALEAENKPVTSMEFPEGGALEVPEGAGPEVPAGTDYLVVVANSLTAGVGIVNRVRVRFFGTVAMQECTSRSGPDEEGVPEGRRTDGFWGAGSAKPTLGGDFFGKKCEIVDFPPSGPLMSPGGLPPRHDHRARGSRVERPT